MMTRHALIWTFLTLLGGGAVMAAFALGFQNSAIGFFGLAVASIILLAVRDIAEASHHEHARQEAMRLAATRLGFSFQATAPFNVLGWPEAFHLTRHGMKTQRAVDRSFSPAWGSVLLPRTTNVIEQSRDDATIAIFDYECDTSRTSDVTTRQTVFALRSPSLEFPRFALIPTTWWNRLIDNVRGNVAMRGAHRVISQDAHAISRIDERLTRLLDGNACLEAGEGFLLLYRRDRLVAPDAVQELLETGLQICSLLSEKG